MNLFSRRRLFGLLPAAALSTTPSSVTLSGDVTITGRLFVTQGTQLSGPVVINQDSGHDALQINGNAAAPISKQLFQVSDRNHAPITSVPPTGGPAVYGDSFRVHGTDIFNADATLWEFGAITLNQRHGGLTIYSSNTDPNVTPPPNMKSDGFVKTYLNGDECRTTYFPYATFKFHNGTWIIP